MPRSSYSTDSSRWNAVQARDSSADGLFVYAVRTTKIYCRPVCKSRRARRANVSFYDRCRDAEREGFRPCKRCKPDVGGGMPEEAAVTRVRTLVEQILGKLRTGSDGQTEYNTEKTGDLALKAKVSKWHFHRIFKEVTGMTPAEYTTQQKDLRSGYSILEDEIWTSTFSPLIMPNFTDTIAPLHEKLNLDIDWEALINDDAMIEAANFNEGS